MPFVPVTERHQSRTTGMNGQLELGRAVGSLVEYDVKSCNDTTKWNNQDKTGSFGQGFTDKESGPITYTFTITFINHVDAPVNLRDPYNVYYVKVTVDGFGVFEGYVILEETGSSWDASADHTVTANATSVIRKVADSWVRPSFTPYEPD